MESPFYGRISDDKIFTMQSILLINVDSLTKVISMNILVYSHCIALPSPPLNYSCTDGLAFYYYR